MYGSQHWAFNKKKQNTNESCGNENVTVDAMWCQNGWIELVMNK